MNRKYLIASIGVVLIVVLAFLFFMKDTAQSPTPAGVSNPVEQRTASDDGSPLPAPDTEAPTQNSGNINITNLSQDEQFVYVRTIIQGVNQGQCKLELSKKGQQNIERQAPIILTNSYYACEGFNISKLDIPAKGEWSIKLSVLGANAESIKTINVN